MPQFDKDHLKGDRTFHTNDPESPHQRLLRNYVQDARDQHHTRLEQVLADTVQHFSERSQV